MSGPEVASSRAAQSRTERVRTCCAPSPFITSPMSGPRGLRPRVGLRPTTPQQEAGMRMEPPPSPPWAMGTMPAATAAAEPPLEPPAVRPLSQGLRVGPNRRGSGQGAGGGLAGEVVHGCDDGVEGGVQPLYALDGGVHKLDGLDLLAPYQFGL